MKQYLIARLDPFSLDPHLPQFSDYTKQLSNAAIVYRVETIVDVEAVAVMTGRETA